MPSFEKSIEFNAYLTDTINRWFFSLINQPIIILDFGCGNGLMTHFIQESFHTAQVTGVDIDSLQVLKNQKEYPKIIFTTINKDILPFADNSFDLIYSTLVMHHIPKQEHAKTFNELLRMLKPNGSLIIFELNPYNWQTKKTFTKEHTADSTMIKPGYLKTTFKNNSCTVKISYLYPKISCSILASLEPSLIHFPFGSLYAVEIKKIQKNS